MVAIDLIVQHVHSQLEEVSLALRLYMIWSQDQESSRAFGMGLYCIVCSVIGC